MKIFNWVHRRFNGHNDGKFAQNVTERGDGQSFPVEKNSILDVFGGWNGGILTIGTFGYGELQSEEVCENEEGSEIDVEDDQISDSDEEKESPLVHAACDTQDYEGLLQVNALLGDDGETAKKVRTTLAELFSADAEEELHEKQGTGKGGNVKEKKCADYKRRLSLAKRLLVIGEDAHRPIHKLQRLMRRMLKRKVHPDLGFDKHNCMDSKVVCTTEFDSLIPTQDPNI